VDEGEDGDQPQSPRPFSAPPKAVYSRLSGRDSNDAMQSTTRRNCGPIVQADRSSEAPIEATSIVTDVGFDELGSIEAM
jgi:hypothetical protein